MVPLLCGAVAPLCAGNGKTNNKTEAEKQRQYALEMNKVTPSAEPSVNMWADPFISADFLWWRIQEDGLEYAFDGAGISPTVDASKGKLRHPSFSYEPGFKVGLGAKFRHDGWDVYAQYTWLSSGGTSSITPSSGSNVMANIFAASALGLPTVSSASATWRSHLNVLDLELGRNFWISKWLTLRPFTGMKFSWNTQDFNVDYLGATDIFPAANLNMDMDLDQFGVGLRSGLDAAFYVCKHWSLFGNLAATTLLNSFDSSRKDTDTTTDVIIDNLRKQSSHRVTAVLECELGVRYELAFHNDDFMFTLQAGWEEQIWFGQNQFIFVPNSASNDLNFEGLTLKAAFNF